MDSFASNLAVSLVFKFSEHQGRKQHPDKRPSRIRVNLLDTMMRPNPLLL